METSSGLGLALSVGGRSLWTLGSGTLWPSPRTVLVTLGPVEEKTELGSSGSRKSSFYPGPLQLERRGLTVEPGSIPNALWARGNLEPRSRVGAVGGNDKEEVSGE